MKCCEEFVRKLLTIEMAYLACMVNILYVPAGCALNLENLRRTNPNRFLPKMYSLDMRA